MGFSDIYRTVITQVRQNKRVRVEHFCKKNLRFFAVSAKIYLVKTSVLMSVAIIS